MMTSWPEQPRFLRLLFSTVQGTTRSIEVSFDRRSKVWSEGAWFDGSSVPGLARVNSSDLLLRPIHREPIIQPWDRRVALALCEVCTPTGETHSHDVRYVSRRAVSVAREMGLELQSGAELEFYLVKQNDDGTIRPFDAGGYLTTTPADQGALFRREAISILDLLGVRTTSHHHEVGRGQNEIGVSHERLPTIGDWVVLARLVVSELAFRKGLIATFMPKPFEGLPGNGMHLHQSLWDVESQRNVFASDRRGELSEMALHYVAGILEHAAALTAVVAPTANSFRRLKPGFEAPTRVAWGPQNRTAMIRVPRFMGPEAARVEVRCPDPLCSPHLAMAALLAAGLDGIRRELEPPEPSTEDLFEGGDAREELPGTLEEATEALARDSVLRDALGESLVDYLVRSARSVWSEYQQSRDPEAEAVTAWERDNYLLAV